MDEGARTFGVWGPLAAADIFAALIKLVSMWAANPEAVKVPKRSEVLSAWALPFMASALRAEEKEAEALALLNSVRRLKAKQEAKG